MMKHEVGPLRFLYVGTDDTDASVAHYTKALGGRLRWRFRRFGADVAGIDLGPLPGPDGGASPVLVLLADHRERGSVLPIYAVDDLEAAMERARAGGAAIDGPLETPEGPAIVVRGPDGGELALIRVERPGALDGAWTDEDNDHRVLRSPAADRPAQDRGRGIGGNAPED
jgi:hypothetical protein